MQHTLIALPLVALLSACASAQDKIPSAGAVQARVPASPAVTTKVVTPPAALASFARMVGGEWKMTADSGTSMYDTWHWGPGKHSLREMTHGEAADHSPWREMWVVYWHPGRKVVCRFGVSVYARGVWDGTIKFEGETAEGIADLCQTGVRRKIGVQWVFDGPDKFRETLLEDSGAGFKPFVWWDHIRSKPGAALTPASTPPADAMKPSERLKPLQVLLGHAWEGSLGGQGDAQGAEASGDALRLQSTFEYVPYADAIYARVVAQSKGGEPVHLLDAYLYHHTGLGRLRCLALSSGGGVYEGDVTVLEGGALQLDLKGYEEERVVSQVVRFDFEKDGTLRQRMWTVNDGERVLMLDVHQRQR